MIHAVTAKLAVIDFYIAWTVPLLISEKDAAPKTSCSSMPWDPSRKRSMNHKPFLFAGTICASFSIDGRSELKTILLNLTLYLDGCKGAKTKWCQDCLQSVKQSIVERTTIIKESNDGAI